ncbi:MAG: hypothetical protein K2V38_27535 [Gemmataceae bacterium]|nr:hypothetical protein [Gemmataceae bacterium]
MIRSALSLSVLSASALALVLASGRAEAQPKDPFTSPEGKYAVKFPGKPKLTAPVAKSAIGDLTVHTALYAAADGSAYTASYTDFPRDAVKAENLKTFFDGVRDGIKGTKGEVVSEKEIVFGPDKLPGRELVVEKEKGKQRIKVRVVLRDNRLYQWAVLGTPEFVAGGDATAFLDSLELTK